MNQATFLLINLALGYYNVGTIWAHEIDIFRSWQYVDVKSFHQIQEVHWRKLPYWIFLPLGLSFIGAIVLIWYHPVGSPVWVIWGNLLVQGVTHVGTALYWGRWQAKLSQDPLGPKSPYLAKFLKTHWIRTLLINAYAFILLVWAIQVLAS